MRRGTSAPSFMRHKTTANATTPRSKYSLIIGFIAIRIPASRHVFDGMDIDRSLLAPSGLWANGGVNARG